MAYSLSDLRKNTSIESLAKQVGNLSNKKSTFVKEEDPRFWTPSVDAAGNGSAVIRLLPAPFIDGPGASPYVQKFHHFFKGPFGKWYVENSLSTIGKIDPVKSHLDKLWQSGIEANKIAYRERKRKLDNISGIQVIKDPKKPECEGKVYLFRYAKKIMEMINAKLNPDEELGEERVNVFDFYEGANFRMKIRQVDGQRNYNLSSFENPSELLGGDDAALDKLWHSQYSLTQFIAPDQFKSFDELQAKLIEVVGPEFVLDNTRKSVTQVVPMSSTSVGEDIAPWEDAPEVLPTQKNKKSKPKPTTPASDVDDDEEEVKRLLAQLSEED